jgi:uncharacterized protein
MSPAARSALDQKLAAYERQTGHQVVVWIGSTLGSRPLDDFTVKAFEAWQLGRKGEDDGLLVTVLAKDRKIGIVVGYGLEGNVPDAIASRIINEVIVPKLAAGNADEALTAGVDAILQRIEGKPFTGGGERAAPSKSRRPSTGQLILFLILGAGFLVLLITNPTLALTLLFVMASRGGRGGGFGGGGFGGGGGRSGGGGARGSW